VSDAAAAEADRERVLVVGPSWVGDMVMAQSMLGLLRARRAATIDVLAPPWAIPVVERMPEVDHAWPADLRHGALALGERRRLARRLAGVGYDRAIVLPNSWKSALVPFLARIPRRTGYRGEMRFGLLNDRRRLDRVALPRTVQRFAALALEPGETLPEPLPQPRLRVAEDAPAVRARLVPADAERPALALCPGAEFGPAKRWPEAHFTALAQRYVEAGWTVWLLGSANDAGPAAAIAEAVVGPHCHDLTGRTTLVEAVDLLASADAVVSNDSGLMHVAAALDRPLVALFGSSDPGHTPPLSPRARVLHLGIACSPCFQRTCPLGHLRCLQELTPAMVADALADAGAPAARP
jgi:heptosyltransferase II